jgi:phosphatidylglycerophosphatase A
MNSPWPGASKHPAFWVATWGGAGMLPKAPGTWGSLAALPCAYVILQAGAGWGLGIAILVVLAAGIWASKVYMEKSKSHDPGQIVVDEVLGQWIVLMPLGAEFRPLEWLVAFGLFRFFDVLKPWPIRLADSKIKGGFGVMFDDILAGIAGAIVMIGYIHVSG